MIIRSCLLLLVIVAASSAEEAVQFNRDVLPILARNCFPCHGPDEEAREADLRLDRRDAALEAGVIQPDALESSELLLRIQSADPDVVMPPPESQRELTATARETLVQWVRQGAGYSQHWAFLPPTRPAVPRVQRDTWPRNQIDAFLLARMEAEGLQPSPAADRYTLVRRVYLDLLGLPPTPAQADAFVSSRSATAYEELVETLLRSPHYGEHLARQWLDVARYADTNGYEKDRPRSIWPYRDWVIQALNRDMPFDQFSIEQLAGDMLPQPSVAQRVATGFHRNTMLNEEGGIDPLEYRFFAMVDRVATTGIAWLGLTVGCAQCHSHKYDPISHRDYYRLMALLNNADEPDLVLPAASEANATARARLDQMHRALADHFPPDSGAGSESERRARHLQDELARWIRDQQRQLADWTVATPTSLRSNLPKLERLADDSVFASGDFTKRDEYFVTVTVPSREPLTALRLEALPDDRLPAGGPGRAYYEGRKGDFFLSEIKVSADSEMIPIASASRSYGKIAIGSGNAAAANVFDQEGSTGWSTAEREGERHVLVLRFAEPIEAAEFDIQMLFERHFVAGLGRFRLSFTSKQGDITALDLAAEVEAILLRDQTGWSDEERARVRAAFLDKTPLLAEARKPIEELAAKLTQRTTTMVMQERAPDHPRPTFLHHRGEWLSPREEVTPGLPSVFPQLPPETPANRLALARWLVSRQNPLVARVVVNRVWRQLMGHGLVRSDGDLGTQADPPSHPQLLDWLACEFMERGWSLKHLHRLIVLSAAYRQQSALASDPAAVRDEANPWFARGPRHRVDAETIRDLMLTASGLLSPLVGGPSVYPPQPDEVTAIAYGGSEWQASAGPQRYRRSLYTFRKRTAPFAAYTTFDGPSHETCTAKRPRSNTPLQALTLLNDAMYLEMARALAAAAIEAFPRSRQQQIAHMFRRLLTRMPSDEEMARLRDYFDSQAERLEQGELVAAELVASEDATWEWAGLTLVARVLMNLDETITKQ